MDEKKELKRVVEEALAELDAEEEERKVLNICANRILENAHILSDFARCIEEDYDCASDADFVKALAAAMGIEEDLVFTVSVIRRHTLAKLQ